jgi:hypothetical protein
VFFLSASLSSLSKRGRQPQEAPFQFRQAERHVGRAAMRAGVGQALVRDRLDKRRHLRCAERVTSTYGCTTGQSGCQVLMLVLRRRLRGRALHSFLESL